VTFESPLLLLTLAVVPLALAGYLLLERRRARFAVNFTNVEVLAAVADEAPAWRRQLPAALLLLALTALCIGIARPAISLNAAQEKATVVLVVDTSGSMKSKDVRPSRLEAAKAAIRQFVDRVPDKLQVGIVSFSDEPQVVTAPTTDRKLLLEGVDLLAPGFGTAIGDALARTVELVSAPEGAEGGQDGAATSPDSKDKPLASILLLSDGFQTRGLISPLEGAERAKKQGMPVYTIALGTPDGTIEIVRDGERAIVPVPPDPVTLNQIAETTGGEFFDAPDAVRLQAVYEQLGSEVGRANEWREATVAFVGGAVALLLGAGILSGLWLPRLP